MLLISPASLMRISWNPFFPYVMRRIEETFEVTTAMRKAYSKVDRAACSIGAVPDGESVVQPS